MLSLTETKDKYSESNNLEFKGLISPKKLPKYYNRYSSFKTSLPYEQIYARMVGILGTIPYVNNMYLSRDNYKITFTVNNDIDSVKIKFTIFCCDDGNFLCEFHRWDGNCIFFYQMYNIILEKIDFIENPINKSIENRTLEICRSTSNPIDLVININILDQYFKSNLSFSRSKSL